MGKTRLAIEVAASLAAEFPDGVWFVDLAPVVDGGDVVRARCGVDGRDGGVVERRGAGRATSRTG